MVRRIKSGLFARRTSDDDDDNVDIGESNAWWAERERIEHAPRPKKRGRDAQPGPDDSDGQDEGGYDAYFATDTLFEKPLEDLPEEPEGELDPDSPFAKLGVEPGAPWREISGRPPPHPNEHKPHPQPDPTAEEAERAANQMAEMNIAYSELKRIYRQVNA